MINLTLRDISPYVTCVLCGGYLETPTTITVCMHTFCRSCLVRHLRDDYNCPECGQLVHPLHPLEHIRHDPWKENLVKLLVPELARNVNRRESYRRLEPKIRPDSDDHDADDEMDTDSADETKLPRLSLGLRKIIASLARGQEEEDEMASACDQEETDDGMETDSSEDRMPYAVLKELAPFGLTDDEEDTE
ncbi:Hypothetical protein NTJ_02642 [Nesidiocoris tenuis]|nr:Hypothetical protein NTJ_02642 [Nesidiocoris tenuis]